MRASLPLLGAVLALAGPAALHAQESPREPGSELIVYHVIMGPGDAVWEKFGHNALWIRDTVAGTDLAYNWGVFDFTSEDFIPRFLKGSMRYWVEAYPTRPMLQAYVESNRSIWTQELALTPAEKHALREFVQWNTREENKFYTYDYYRDNCSTRVRDALNRVLDGRLRAWSDTVMSGTTYRWHTRRLTQEMPAMYGGIDIMLGQPTDREISRWEEMFLPMQLQHHLRRFTVVGPAGVVQPLVVAEREIFVARRAAEPDRPPRSFPVFLMIGLAIATLIVMSGVAARRGSAAGHGAAAVQGVLWPALFGVAGLLLLATWLFTSHEAAFPNENLLQLSPLALALAVIAPVALRRGHWQRGAIAVATIIAGLSVAGLVLQLTPWFDQVNGETIALALPVNLALLWLVRRGGPHRSSTHGPAARSKRSGTAGSSAPRAPARL